MTLNLKGSNNTSWIHSNHGVEYTRTSLYVLHQRFRLSIIFMCIHELYRYACARVIGY